MLFRANPKYNANQTIYKKVNKVMNAVEIFMRSHNRKPNKRELMYIAEIKEEDYWDIQNYIKIENPIPFNDDLHTKK